MKILNNIAIRLLRLYQYFASPYLGHWCRFAPSCSHYAIAAYQEYGFGKATYKTAHRLLRCHPWGADDKEDDNLISKRKNG